MDSTDGAQSHTAVTVYLRVVALSVACYHYLQTLPAEWGFLRSQRSWRLSPGCAFFIAIRYISILALVISNIGYFGAFFTEESCAKYHIVAPVLKVIQTVVSQVILGIRTVNVSRRTPWVLWTTVIACVLVSTAEAYLNLSNRVPLLGQRGNCVAGDKPPRLTVWLFYIFAMVYDAITLCISSAYLLAVSPTSGKMEHVVRIMLTDGLVYFVALTGANVLNLILYRSTDEAYQSSGATLGYTLTWIMSQRMLIHLREAATEHSRTQIVASHQFPSAQSISQPIRFGTNPKSRAALSNTFDLEEWSVTSSSHRVATPQIDGQTLSCGHGIQPLRVHESRRSEHVTPTASKDEGEGVGCCSRGG